MTHRPEEGGTARVCVHTTGLAQVQSAPLCLCQLLLQRTQRGAWVSRQERDGGSRRSAIGLQGFADRSSCVVTKLSATCLHSRDTCPPTASAQGELGSGSGHSPPGAPRLCRERLQRELPARWGDRNKRGGGGVGRAGSGFQG